jgi:hypothetical protein
MQLSFRDSSKRLLHFGPEMSVWHFRLIARKDGNAMASLSCYQCDHNYKNDSSYQKRINGKFLKGQDEYCGYDGPGKKMKKIGTRDRPRGHLHPVWCPLYTDAGSCIECGKAMYGSEDVTCAACKRKGL